MKPDTFIRARNPVPTDALIVIFTVLAAGVLGATVTKSPVVAVALVGVSAGLAIALTRPALLFGSAILLLAVEPTMIFGANSFAGRSESYKLALYVCILPLLLYYGIDRRKCAPLAAYVAVAMLTESVATPLAGLTTAQTAASLATLCLGWLVFAIDWEWQRDYSLLKVLAWMPTFSVLVGLTLDVMGILPLFRATPPRLQGATIAAWLGTFSLCAVIACLMLYRREQWRWARWLGIVNVAILGATLTRGAVLALCIVAVPSLVRFGKSQLSMKGTAGIVRSIIAVGVTIVGVAILVPGLAERNENAKDYVVGRGSEHEITSGRLQAWAVAYAQAKTNIVFGRGIGAGPIVGKTPGSPAGFTAQHNEYVRMLLEGGIVGGAVVFVSIFMTMISAIRRAPMLVRADLAAAGIAFAIYSITENTLSATPIAVAFLLVFGIGCSRVGSLNRIAGEVRSRS